MLDTRPGLYVHLPFCVTRCPYCDFFSSTGATPAAMGRLVEAVLDEARLRINAQQLAWQEHAFGSLYLGGGTPSAVPQKQLLELLAELPAVVALAPDAEITIEINPDDVQPDLFPALRTAGVNRISLGIQAFDDASLTFLGRRHDAATGRRAIVSARAAGFARIGLDLIFGLPGQSSQQWRRTLEQALAYEPEHLSCYQLTIEPDTPFARQGQTAANETVQAELFELTSELLRQAGYVHYEVSNFARGMEHVSQHNSRYWRHVPYLGLGPSAHSFDGHNRWWNVNHVTTYCEAIESGTLPQAEHEELSEQQFLMEQVQLGFRTMWGAPQAILDATTVAAMRDEGLVTVRAGHVCPTSKGLAMAEGLALRALPL